MIHRGKGFACLGDYVCCLVFNVPAKAFLIILLFLLKSLEVYGQLGEAKDQLLHIKSSEDSLIKSYPAEKLYLQLDKPNYAVGDTLWFKAYLFHAPTLALSAKSGIMYIDIADDGNKVIKKLRLPVSQGISWGNISLSDVAAGNYTLRAYTTWMRNFGEECFFYQRFTVVGEPKDNVETGSAISLSIVKRLAAGATIKSEKRSSQVDVQFLPEGGKLVAGLPAHIGFKAIGGDGRGLYLAGIIVDSENRQVATFSALHLGMGSFDLPVKPGEHYTAKVNLPYGTVSEFPLPSIKVSGTVLNVINPSDQDSVIISIAATIDLVQPGNSYFLIGKARNVICYAAVINFNSAGTIRKNLPKGLFPSGVAHFILMNAQNQPLNERLIFIDHHDNLPIKIEKDKPAYEPHDSVAMHIRVSDINGNPVKGNFSVAVTDDNQVNIDSLQDNIYSHLLLSSELKGYLEQPDYYFETGNETALDNLLLTQGWVNYDWTADKQKPQYAPEQELAVNGRVINGFNKPVKGSRITLLSKRPPMLIETLTNNEGHFTFHRFPQIDTPIFFLSAVNRNNNSFNVGIVMDDVKPPSWNIHLLNDMADTLADTGLVVVAKNNRVRKEQTYLTPNSHLLKEVRINAKKIVKDSQNLNGPGNADLVLDEEDVVKEGKKSWLEVFLKKIKGFKEVTYYHSPDYFIYDREVIFLVDGDPIVPMNAYPYLDYLDDIANALKIHSAEDIKGIEANISSEFNMRYNTLFFPGDINADFAYIDITTRSGHGPQLDNTPGNYLYKPLALSKPAQFYSPRYTVTDTAKHLPDTRSTIYWQPNVSTAADGSATVLFYTADKPSTYTLIIQGTDMNGGLGYKKVKMRVTNQKTAGK